MRRQSSENRSHLRLPFISPTAARNDYAMYAETDLLSDVGSENTDDASHRTEYSDRADTETRLMEALHNAMTTMSHPINYREQMRQTPYEELRGTGQIFRRGDDESDSDEEENTLLAAQNLLQRQKILAGVRQSVKGIYDGGRSTSVSPCPAPFVTTFDATLNGHKDDQKSLLEETSTTPDSTTPAAQCPNSLQVALMAKLYLCFKRADIANDDWPSTVDIKRSFLRDPVVQDVFHLEKRPIPKPTESISSQIGDTTPRIKLPSREEHIFAANSSMDVALSSKTTEHSYPKSAIFGMQYSDRPPETLKEAVVQCWDKLWLEWRTEDSASSLKEPIPITGKPSSFSPSPEKETFFQRCHRLGRQLFHISKHIYDREDTETPEWTPKSRVKVSAMIARLHNIETDSVIKLSKRSIDSAKIGFPNYAKIFAPFVGNGDWRAVAAGDEPRKAFQEIQHRLLGPSISERLVRDGYLGTNLSQYEIALPGRLAPPITIRMEGPSCALAPRNRSGLPRHPTVGISDKFLEEASEEELKVIKETEAKTESLLKQTMMSMVKYRAEADALRQKIETNNERLFALDTPKIVPSPSLFNTYQGDTVPGMTPLKEFWEQTAADRNEFDTGVYPKCPASTQAVPSVHRFGRSLSNLTASPTLPHHRYEVPMCSETPYSTRSPRRSSSTQWTPIERLTSNDLSLTVGTTSTKGLRSQGRYPNELYYPEPSATAGQPSLSQSQPEAYYNSHQPRRASQQHSIDSFETESISSLSANAGRDRSSLSHHQSLVDQVVIPPPHSGSQLDSSAAGGQRGWRHTLLRDAAEEANMLREYQRQNDAKGIKIPRLDPQSQEEGADINLTKSVTSQKFFDDELSDKSSFSY